MANSEQVIYVNMNTEGVRSVTEDLNKELLVLRLAFGKLKAEITRAVAPIGAVFIPMVQKAVWAATRLTKSVGRVIAALFGYGNAVKTVAKANAKANRSLMGFDEINRLNGSADADSQVYLESYGELSPQLQAVVDKIQSILAPLRQIDFAPAVEAFGRLKEAIAPISQTLFAGLNWAWHNLFVPLAKWTIENFMPAFLDMLASSLGVLNSVIVALQPGVDWLWGSFLKPLALWTGEQIIAALGSLRQRLDGISVWISQNPELVQKLALAASAISIVNGLLRIFTGVGGSAIGVLGGFLNPLSLVSGAMKALRSVLLLLVPNWTGVKDAAVNAGSAIGAVWSGANVWLGGPISSVCATVKRLISTVLLLSINWDGLKNAAVNAWSAIRATWAGAAGWLQSNLLIPIAGGFRSMVNGIIGFLNAMIAGIVSGINGIVNAVNKLSFSVPDWIPGIGGKTIGFNLKPVNTPKIPYLAQGAVLPANRPFMAVVGDQKHGTNIEAPLETIKQALAEVLGNRDSETVVQVNFGGDLAQLARVLKPAIELETRRRGSSLAKGGVY